MEGQATIAAGPATRKKNQAFGIVSERLRHFYSQVEAMVDPNTEDFVQRVMRQAETNQPRARVPRPGPSGPVA